MIQNLSTLKKSTDDYNRLIESFQEGAVAAIQKIFSSPHFISMSLRLPGQNLCLALGRGGSCEGIFQTDKLVPSNLRVIDRFLEYLRKYMKGAQIAKMRVDEHDRILIFEYRKGPCTGVFAFFYRSHDLFFSNYILDGEVGTIFRSWRAKEGFQKLDHDWSVGDQLKDFDSVGRRTEDSGAKGCVDCEDTHLDWKTYSETVCDAPNEQVAKKQLKQQRKKADKILSDIAKLSSNKVLKEKLENENWESYVLQEKVSVHNQFIKVKGDTPYQRRDFLYKKTKSYQNALELQERRLKECQTLILALQSKTVTTKKLPPTVNPVWESKDKKEKTETTTQAKDIDIFSLQGKKIGVGKTAHGNDALRSKFAKDNDWWFHLDGDTSAHLVIKMESINDLTEESWSVIGSLVSDYSGQTYQQIALIYTQVKNLKGVKGSPGKVRYTKVKHRLVGYSPDWRARITID